MVQLASQAASAHTFNEAALRQTLQAIAQRSYATDQDIKQALEEGFARDVAQALTYGIMTRDEEDRLRAFRYHLALEDNAAGPGGQRSWPGRHLGPGPGLGGAPDTGSQAGRHLRP